MDVGPEFTPPAALVWSPWMHQEATWLFGCSFDLLFGAEKVAQWVFTAFC